jgi:transposase
MGVSGRAMLDALIDGRHDPAQMAELAKRRLRSEIPALTEALNGRFNEHHGFLARIHLDLIDRHTQAIDEITDRIEVVIEPFRGFRDLICSIPGISTDVADVVTAETGADMSQFPHGRSSRLLGRDLPGKQRIRRRIKSTKTRPATLTSRLHSEQRPWRPADARAPI